MDPQDPRSTVGGPARIGQGDLLRRLIDRPATQNRGRWAALIAGLVLAVGLVDYVTGFDLSLQVFYLLPVCIAVASLGWRAGLLTAVASVVTWILGDFAAGASYARLFIPVWNALIALGAYCVVVWLFSHLVAMHREMEERVRQRTTALTEEIAERERLEKAVLEISERERRSIGHDLHDGLGQHLTGTALIGKALVARLREGQLNATGDVERIVSLVEKGIEQSRALAKGLLLAEIEHDGLAGALQEFAAATREQFNVSCDFSHSGALSLEENGTATHLYRIAQEAVRNAVRHGRARQIHVELSAKDSELELSISDDGVGLPPVHLRHDGLGLRIMAHRAAMIGGTLTVEAMSDGGTHVLCRLSQDT